MLEAFCIEEMQRNFIDKPAVGTPGRASRNRPSLEAPQ